MQGWSQFLKMSGYKRVDERGKRPSFVADPESPWSQRLTPTQLDQLRANVRVAPAVYGTHRATVAGESKAVTAKIHHKLMSVGTTAVLATSFNFSQGAETNNEQVVIFKDAYLASAVEGIARWLIERSPRSVAEEAQRRNVARERAAESDSSPAPEAVSE